MREVFTEMPQDEIQSNQLSHIYCELAELVGTEAALKIHAVYRGQQINFPVNLFTKEFVQEQILREYDGTNVKQLASKFGYSEKWIRTILKTKERN